MPEKVASSLNNHRLPQYFSTKKSHILASLATPDNSYTDKSPKGSVDAPIRELIEQINAVNGWVTTSSCSGRIAVFAEGSKGRGSRSVDKQNDIATAQQEDSGASEDYGGNMRASQKRQTPAGPGGKGNGGRWLFVSHEPLHLSGSASTSDGLVESDNSRDRNGKSKRNDTSLIDVFGLRNPQPKSTSSHSNYGLPSSPAESSLRLIRLEFSPLILHVFCASLHHARYLLSAAINAGFRESGVQSLKALEEPDAGVMVAIRTAGVGFETVIGMVKETSLNSESTETMEAVVGEEYLQMCVTVVNERFVWNEERRERLREELRKVIANESGKISRETKDERRVRKREEGLRRKRRDAERSNSC